jgi:hypothetical protein
MFFNLVKQRIRSQLSCFGSTSDAMCEWFCYICSLICFIGRGDVTNIWFRLKQFHFFVSFDLQL